MAFWLIIAVIVGGALIAGRLAPPRPAPKGESSAVQLEDDEALWTPEALARLGTPETVADLVAQGRADELRGLGYKGALPPEG